jgi:hypothetical protein
MKRIKSRFTLFLILSSLLIPALSFTPIPEVKGAELTFFEDDFESYQVGTFPTSGGWELWYNGMGNEYQVIVDSVSNSPEQSLQLLGDHSRNWAAYAVRPFVTDLPKIGFNVSVKVSEIGDRNRVIAQVGFGQNLPPNRATTFAPIYFLENGTITVSGFGSVLPYVAEKWYKVTVIMDRNSETFSVWIDNVLQGQNLTVRTNRGPMTASESTWDIEGFSASQDFYSVKVFFDDVKVFSVFNVDPKLELVPATGIAATTLVGSGFAPNSRISVTWDDTPIPTVPSPLITDGYGNFTVIISVLNQTTSGSYTVKAIDEIGTEATATFTVTLAQSQSVEEQNSETPSMSGLPSSLELLGGGARWAAEEGSSALFINWKDNWLAHHLTDGTTWSPWPLETDMDDRRFSIAYALEQAGFDVDFAGDIPETLTNYDLVVISAFWAVEPQDASLIKDYISDGGGVVVLSGVPCYFSVYCKDMWPYRAYGSEFDGYRFGLEPIQEWFGARYYINVGGYPHLAFDNPFGTTLSFGDTLMGVQNKDAASVAALSSNTQLVALWDSGTVFSFTHKYGQGRLYYQASYECVSADILETRELGLADGAQQSTVYDNYTGSDMGEPATVWSSVDTTPPNITDVIHVPVSANGTLEEGVRVNATVTDAESEVERVALKYSDGNGKWVTTEMTKLEGDVWNGDIPAFPHGTNVTYIIIAEDTAGNTVTTEELTGAPNHYEVLPEFPLWIVLPLFLVATASTLAVRKQLHIPDFTKISSRLHRLLT